MNRVRAIVQAVFVIASGTLIAAGAGFWVRVFVWSAGL